MNSNQNDLLEKLRKLSPSQRVQLQQQVMKQSAKHAGTPGIPKQPRTGEKQAFPMSFAQQRMWFLDQWQPENALYNIPAVFEMHGYVDPLQMAHCLNDLIARHESLRTQFGELNDEPVQWILPSAQLSLDYSDLRHLPVVEGQNVKSSLQKAQATKPFNLTTDLLIRAHLIQLTAEKAELLITTHHIISDGWSIGVFLDELSQIYFARSANQPILLPEMPIQYADFSVWQRTSIQGEYETKLADFWKSQFPNPVPILELPTERPRPSQLSYRGARETFYFSNQTLRKINQFCQERQISPYMLELAVYFTLLHRYSGQDEIIVGMPIANRNRKDTERLIGFFVNTLPIRIKTERDESFKILLQKVREQVLTVTEYQDYPLEKVIEALNLQRTISHSALFQTVFIGQNMRINKDEDTAHASSPSPNLIQFVGAQSTATSKFDITFSIAHHQVAIEYNTDIFSPESIRRMYSHFLNLLESAIQAPNSPIGRLSLLSASEYRQLVIDWNSACLPLEEKPFIHQQIEYWAEHTPEQPAVLFEGKSLTYRELNNRANQLARHLIAQGFVAEEKVAVYLDRSIDIVIAFLAVLKAGLAYIPLDPIYPKELLASMLETAQPEFVISTAELKINLQGWAKPVFCIDTEMPSIAGNSTQNMRVSLQPEQLMYILFTSGSTGKPKGVAITHQNFSNYLAGLQHRLQLAEPEQMALVSTLAADLGTTNLYGALCGGGTVHIFPYERATDPLAFIEYFQNHSVDSMKLVPSHFEALRSQTNWQSALPQKRLILAGEASNWELVESIRREKPELDLQVHYGPTETTVSMLMYPTPAENHPPTHHVPLGKPIPNVNAYVLDTNLQPVPVGIPGELYVAGAGVARGYINQPGLTADRFLPDPFDINGGRMYRTGDLVRYLASGDIEFLGRIDLQVKVRGYRVELGAIESYLQQHPAIHNAVVVSHTPTKNQTQLVAYLVAADGHTLDVAKIRSYLREKLPDYMVPSIFMLITALPLNPNGKVDRKNLPAPNQNRYLTDEFIAPHTEAEIKIAHIWCEILSLPKVGIDDNFFDLGGESFKAIRVVRAMSQSFGQNISVMQIFKFPTIRELAQQYAEQHPQNADIEYLYHLTPDRNPQTTTATVLAIPYGGGSAISYQPLAHKLSKSLALFAIELPGHDFSRPLEKPEPNSVALTKCIEEIRQKVQGPILIYGHCVGSAFAIQLAEALVAQNLPLKGVMLGGTFPSARLPGQFFDWLYKLLPTDRWMSNRTYHEFLRSLGGFTDIVEPAEQQFVLNALRHDVRQAEDFFTQAFSQPNRKKLPVPIHCVIGEMDRATELYEERYLEWSAFSETVSYQVIPEAGHYFLKHQAQELASIFNAPLKPQPASLPHANQIGKQPKRLDAQVIRNPWLVFLTVILGETLSTLGSALTGFGISIWVFQKTGSVMSFSMMAMSGLLPGLLAMPIAGAVADRYDKRKVMLIADLFAAIASVFLLLSLWQGELQMWQLYVTSAIGAIAGAFQRPAYSAGITQLIPKQYLGHANGLIQFGGSLTGLIAPLLGAYLVMKIRLEGVLILDLLTFLFAVAMLLLVRFPSRLFYKRQEPLLQEVLQGWQYIMRRKSMVALVVFFVISNIWFSIGTILLTPMALAVVSPTSLSHIFMAGTVGGILGGLIMSIWGGTRWRATGMLGFVIVEGIFLVVMGIHPSVWAIGLGLLGVNLCVVLINSHWQALIQAKVGFELQGRVLATNQMLAMFSMPIGFYLSGYLSDSVLEPWIQSATPLAQQVHFWLGGGEARGMALLVVIVGVLQFFWAILGLQYHPLRWMEKILPDAIPGELIARDRNELQRQADLALTNPAS
jgi:amino acid adenylation domain-containing protein